MPESKISPSSPKSPLNSRTRPWPLLPLLLPAILLPVVAAIVVYQLDSFDAAPMPLHELSVPFEPPLLHNDHMLQGAEFLGAGKLPGPEDFAYDSRSQVIYTGTVDGWIKLVWVNDSGSDTVVEDWVNTGGRPLGLTLGLNQEVIVADAYKGLLKISRDGAIEVLADEAEAMKFKLTDGVDVAKDGTVYFTDASYKYNLHEFFQDIMEGRPRGRLIRFDPISKRADVLLTDLYFANGIAVSPHQDCVIFCETPMRRCRKYYIEGHKKGHVEKFIDNLPGMPDNIKYDGDGHYWIALPTGNTMFWDIAMRYPMVRKAAAMVDRWVGWIGRIKSEKNGGLLVVDINGKPVAHYRDVELTMVTSGFKLKNHLYIGSFILPYIIRVDLDQHPAGHSQ
ncbi:protein STRICTOSIDINE SYNTHASE-LIKE 5 [Gossypium raimondii]|uniref:Strictosidine synthase conserved region domain-containing protein n=1 Tax=Gossypium raimondii TaxID=29730 RepID=A0A0D2NUD9_GOSRA|nr:protein STRICTOSIDINE SYNTHASE-LIKE 5 [Gossypium raimondii]KJB17523.1 hypothetical protein B456_003G003500 [Gossypium raimondii]MBA0581606.1 hypothetical protein [Gossypium raimondii]